MQHSKLAALIGALLLGPGFDPADGCAPCLMP